MSPAVTIGQPQTPSVPQQRGAHSTSNGAKKPLTDFDLTGGVYIVTG